MPTRAGDVRRVVDVTVARTGVGGARPRHRHGLRRPVPRRRRPTRRLWRGRRDRRLGRGAHAARAAALGVPRGTADVDALLDDPEHRRRPCLHAERHARRARDGGRSRRASTSCVEKPLALRLGEAHVAWPTWPRGVGRHAMVALTYRGYPMVRRARRARAQAASSASSGSSMAATSRTGCRRDRLQLAPRALGGRVPRGRRHRLPLVRYRRVHLRPARRARCSPISRRSSPSGRGPADARPRRSSRQHGRGEAVDVQSEDAATILLRFEGGARGAAVISQVSPGREERLHARARRLARDARLGAGGRRALWIGSRDEARRLTRQPTTGRGRSGMPSLPAGHPEGWAEALRDLLRPSTPPLPMARRHRLPVSRPRIRRSATARARSRWSRPSLRAPSRSAGSSSGLPDTANGR